MVRSVNTKDELVGILQSKELVVVDFTAIWCGPCKVIAPEFEKLAELYTKVTFLKVDVDVFEDTAEFEISGVPTFLLYKDNKELKRVVGSDLQRLEDAIVELCK